jgi:2-polyprenyl-3-methyl-5-hydroxy-6-metoxy-1,4-benzoquinol methylase
MQRQKTHRYALKVGEAGAPRLKLLNDMCNPFSLDFIKKIIKLKNKTILDLACGIGILSCKLAKESLPNGHVVAADISQEQLDVAKKNATEEKISNIEFIKISAYDIDTLGIKFDLIFCRFLLIHLEHATDVIKKISTLMHSTSILICEEANSVDSLSCQPVDPVFEQFKRMVFKQVEFARANFSLGKELPSLFSKNNYTILKKGSSQAILDTKELKQQLWQGIVEISSLLVDNKYITETELQKFIVSLKNFADHSDAQVKYFECTQISVKYNDHYDSHNDNGHEHTRCLKAKL